MTKLKSSFLKEATERGFIHQGTNLSGLDEKMAAGSITAYIGFDATAPSLHAGNLIQIMQLRLLQKHGHKPLVLMGDGTTRIGDPSGRDKSRQLLTQGQIETNVQGIQKVFSRYLAFGSGGKDALLIRNSEWLLELNYIDFLRDYGRHFSINRMLSFDSVKLRLDREQPLSFLEFNYMIFQAYDFLKIYGKHGCLLQLGGSDQWGNIVNGIDLIRRIEGQEVFGLTAPLITTSSGQKMGKTAEGAVWLNQEMLSPFEFWQYWRNVQDSDVGRFLKLYTDLPLQEVDKLEKLQNSEINEAKKILADEVTRLCHGEKAVSQARATAQSLFETKGNTASLDTLPTLFFTKEILMRGVPLVDILKSAGLTSSNSEARRLIRGGGARLNDHPIEKEEYILTLQDMQTSGYAKLSAGKKRHALIKVS